MSQGLPDYYSVLGVARTATAAGIRTAYLRLVREHSPESDPEVFRLVSMAYRVLSNPKKRRVFDAQEELPRHLVLALARAAGTTPDRLGEALVELYEIVSTWPAYRQPRFALGVALCRIGRHLDAAGIFRSLVDDDPQSPEYALWLGDALIAAGQEEAGVAALKQAIVLDSGSPPAVLRLAQWHLGRGEVKEALRVLNRGILAEESPNLSVLPLILYKMGIRLAQDDRLGLVVDLRRIRALIPEDDEPARLFVAARLSAIAKTLDPERHLRLRVPILQVLAELEPEDDELRGEAVRSRTAYRTARLRLALARDRRVERWIVDLVEACEEGADADQRSRVSDATCERLQTRRRDTLAAWERARASHPEVLRRLDEIWASLCALPWTPAPGYIQTDSTVPPWLKRFVRLGPRLEGDVHCGRTLEEASECLPSDLDQARGAWRLAAALYPELLDPLERHFDAALQRKGSGS